MSIEIATGAAKRLARERGYALIQIRSREVTAAARALELAATRIAGLDADQDEVPYLDLAAGETATPKMVSNVIPAPSGPMLALDLGEDLPATKIREIPEIIAQALREVGVSEATIRCPRRGGKLEQLIRVPSWEPHQYPFGAGMLLWRPVATPVPESWVKAAMDWLSGAASAGMLAADVGNVQFELDVDAGRALLRQIIDSRSTSCLLVAGNLRRHVRTVHVTTIFTNRLTLAERGPKVRSQDRVGAAEQLALLGRAVAADVEYAAVDLDVGDSFSSWFQCGMNSSWFEHWGTELVDGVYWWQLLGDGHLARMADTAGCVELPTPGRYELRCGEPAQWLPDLPSRAELQRTCRDRLERCFDEAVPDPAGGMMLPPID